MQFTITLALNVWKVNWSKTILSCSENLKCILWIQRKLKEVEDYTTAKEYQW